MSEEENMLNEDVSDHNLPKRKSSVDKRKTEQEPDKKNKCKKCTDIFPTQRSLDNHNFRAHNNTKECSCELCVECFEDANKLQQHLDGHSDEKCIKCNQCNRFYKSKSALCRHKSYAHATERPFRCEVCSEGFATVSFLKRHSVKHSEERPHKCDECSLAFKEQSTLNNHMANVHEKDCKFSCGVCKKTFRHMSRLNDHLAGHSDERGIKCDQCERIYKRKTALCEHKTRMHSDKSNFKCSQCDKTYKTKKGLSLHEINIHLTERPFQCKLCPKNFLRSANFDKHFEKAHREEIEEVYVKVKPEMLYDLEVKQVISDEIKEEMDLDVKQEPQDIDES